MSTQKRYPLLVVTIILGAMFLLSACNPVSVGINPPGSNDSLTPLQVLQNSANTMKQLKSAHIDLQSTSSFKVADQATQTVTASPTATATGSNKASFTIKGSGDESLPDQEQLKLTINQNTNVAEIVQGDKVYVQNAQGQWYVLNKSDFSGLASNPFSGVNIDQNSLLGLIQHATIVDHGKEDVQGQSLRHISASLDKTALQQLLNQNPQLVGQLGQQNVNDVLSRTKVFNSSIDVWIDESHFYLHQAELKLNLTADTSGVEGAAPSSASTSLDTMVNLSKFNDPVTITPPANATPASNPAAIFGDAKP